MQVSLDNIGKKFIGNQWIFRNLNFHIKPTDRVAFTGHNGSGKSTLVQIIAGSSLPSEGKVIYSNPIKEIKVEEAIPEISYAAPYIELIEEYTLKEFLKFHFQFKKLNRVSNLRELIEVMYLNGHENKLIKFFSSGMKQRLKLAITFYSKSELILLDEPTTNLDSTGTKWYIDQIKQISSEIPIIIASNQEFEYEFCNKVLNVSKD
ncbi:ABC transporter ATP-binding protein [Reichenbachiella versicolor]|uniref:ABC transporter ATP-binding protein n=1 Tax=Reichenbachiella versicolor TaxID=1821036 RepID=UPI000D6E9B19|nr:ATP-binding cassette domain-containing protein [Reichenbachiella versicolor]